MALTHTHRAVLEDFSGDSVDSSHLDNVGNSFGHDEHTAFVKKRGNDSRASWEHTHEGVEERYDAVADQIRLHPVKTKEEAAAEQKVAEAEVALEEAQRNAANPEAKAEAEAEADDKPVATRSTSSTPSVVAAS
jgi:hypothetical protein